MAEPNSASSIIELYKEITAAGVPFMLFAILVLLYKRIFILGSYHQERITELTQDRDWWKTAFLRASQHTDKALDAGLTIARVATPSTTPGAPQP